MRKIIFIQNFPEIKEKNSRYYLYLGIVFGLSANEILMIINQCLEQDTLKRKILVNKIIKSAGEWSIEDNNKIFIRVFNLKNSLTSYYKKETASMILMTLFPHVSRNNQDKLAGDFSQSKYKNNRKRIYNHFYKNWSASCQQIIEKAWNDFKDKELIGLIVANMSKEFLLKNLKEISGYFIEEDLTYDFFKRILRNKFYARLYEEIPLQIKKLKKTDPISFIAIKKERREKINIKWAIKTYKKYSRSRFLARWYSEMRLWDNILKEEPDFLSEI